MHATYFDEDDTLVLRLSDKPIVREVSQDWNTHISHAEEHGFGDLHVPFHQGTDRAFVGGGSASGDEGGADLHCSAGAVGAPIGFLAESSCSSKTRLSSSKSNSARENSATMSWPSRLARLPIHCPVETPTAARAFRPLRDESAACD